MVATRRMLRTTLMILGAWCMGLVISLPLHGDAPGFINFNVTNESLAEPGGCIPPILPDSKERNI